MKILIVCPSLATHASGNTCTVQRIQNHLLSNNIECLTCEVANIVTDERECSLRQYYKYIMKQNIDGVLLLHAYKSGNVLFCKCQACSDITLPNYGIIFGGTDLNVDIHDIEKYEAMQEVLERATFAVAFTEDLKRIGPELAPNLKILIQPQAVNIETKIDLNDNFEGDVNFNIPDSMMNTYTFIMVTGIRPVKDPMFLLERWMKWSEEVNDLSLKLLILGPVLDNEYAKIFFDKLHFFEEKYTEYTPISKRDQNGICEIYSWITKKDSFPIYYVPSISRRNLTTLMNSQSVFAAVNTSESEGMSSAILESMANKLPVIARNIPGNNAVISDGETGLLFSTVEEFIKQAERLISDQELRNRITSNAYERILEEYCLEKESAFYTKLCRDYFS